MATPKDYMYSTLVLCQAKTDRRSTYNTRAISDLWLVHGHTNPSQATVCGEGVLDYVSW